MIKAIYHTYIMPFLVGLLVLAPMILIISLLILIGIGGICIDIVLVILSLLIAGTMIYGIYRIGKDITDTDKE